MMKKLLRVIEEHPIWTLWIICGAVRIVYLSIYYSSPEWDHLIVDSLYHHRWASDIADGTVLGSEPFFRAPFYIYSLGLIYSIFGKSLLAARVFGLLIGLLSTTIVFQITGRVFNKQAALLSGLIFGLYPSIIYFESELLVETLFTMLLLLSVWYLIKSFDSKSNKYLIFSALFFGLASITRPVILPLGIIYFVYMALYKFKMKQLIYFALVSIAVISPVAIRNYVVSGDTVLIASSGGINFYLGNNEEADGLSAVMPPPLGADWSISDIRFIAETEKGGELQMSEVSNYWYARGLDWIGNNFGSFLKLYLKKIYFFFNNAMISNNRDLFEFYNSNSVLKYNPLNFGILLSLSGAGIVLLGMARKFNRVILLLLGFIFVYILVLSLFFINERFRLPILPILTIFSGFAIHSIYKKIIAKERISKFIYPAIGGTVLLFFSLSNPYGISYENKERSDFNGANYRLHLGDFDSAYELYQRVLKSAPGYPDANLNLGALFLVKGDLDSARHYFEQELIHYPANAKAYANLASLAQAAQDYESGISYAIKAIKLKPYEYEPHIILFRTYYAQRNFESFEEAYNQSLLTVDDRHKMQLEAGIIYYQFGRKAKAVELLEMVLSHHEGSLELDNSAFGYRVNQQSSKQIKAEAAYQLGFIFGTAGDLQESISYSNRAIKLDSNLVEAYINLINGYSISGMNSEALNILQIAKAKFPNNQLIRKISDQ